MASELVGGRAELARLKTTRTGALAQNAVFFFGPELDQAAYQAFYGQGFDAVQVMSPINSAGAADLRVQTGRGFDQVLAGGGNVLTVPGPIASLRITALNAAVGGAGSDDVLITPLSRLKTTGSGW